MIDINHGTGCILSEKDIRDFKLNKAYAVSYCPKEFLINHSDIKDQGLVGSCVAHSIAEVLECMTHYTNLSTAWVYGYRPFGYYQGYGMMTSQALKTIRKFGYIEYENCPGNIEMPLAKEYISKDIDNFKSLAKETKEQPIVYARLKSVDEIKKALYTNNNPIIVCIKTSNLELDENNIALIPEIMPESGHAVVCYGWNEIGLLIQNSWGKNWGDNGCFILPYEYPVNEAWIITKIRDTVKRPKFFKIRQLLHSIKKKFKKYRAN